jgi:hypothetical protein
MNMSAIFQTEIPIERVSSDYTIAYENSSLFYSKNQSIFDSTEVFTSKLTDIGNVFILPPICFFGLIANLINIVVILQPEFKGTVYHIMLMNTITDFCFLSIMFFIVIIRCGSLCPYGYTFASKVYEQYIYLFIGNTFLLFGTLHDIYISLARLGSFKRVSLQNKQQKLDFKWVCVILFVFSLIINTPSYIITRNVQKVGLLRVNDSDDELIDEQQMQSNITTSYEPIYFVLSNELGRNPFVKTFLFVLIVIRGFFLLIVLFLINLVIAYKYKKYMKKKRRIIPVLTTLSKQLFAFRQQYTFYFRLIYHKNY